MRNKKLYVSIFITICIIGGLAYNLQRYYAPPRLRPPYQTNTAPDDTLRIAFIGDSWAYLHKDHKCIIAQMLQDSLLRPFKVHSYGLCGYTSKEIYNGLFENEDFKQFICKKKYDFAIISAGINDVNKKICKKYYKDSMNGIITFLLSNNIYPIILEIPDFNVFKIYRWWRIDKKLLRIISMRINNVPLDCKQLFRNSLDSLLFDKKNVSVIRYKLWNNEYLKDQNSLYLGDGLHLNEQGYAKLDSVIAKEIISLIVEK